MEDKIYVDVNEFERLCRLDGRVDALIAYVNEVEKNDTGTSYISIGAIKAIIGTLDD